MSIRRSEGFWHLLVRILDILAADEIKRFKMILGNIIYIAVGVLTFWGGFTLISDVVEWEMLIKWLIAIVCFVVAVVCVIAGLVSQLAAFFTCLVHVFYPTNRGYSIAGLVVSLLTLVAAIGAVILIVGAVS